MSHNQSATREIKKKYILIYSIYTRQQQCKWAKIGKVVQVVDASKAKLILKYFSAQKRAVFLTPDHLLCLDFEGK